MTKTLPPFCHRKDLTKELKDFQKQIRYSDKYCTDYCEYRHVILPKKYYSSLDDNFKKRLLLDDEWRYIGICQSPGWEHYLIHSPEPHIFLFKRSTMHSGKQLKRKSMPNDSSFNKIKSRKKSDNILRDSKSTTDPFIKNKRRSLRIANNEKLD